ncbi:MAG: hypothetical protein R3B52_02360 [Candidatus Paceibacterota bacterium]
MKKFGSIEQFKAENGYDFDDGWYPRVTRIVEMKAKPALLKFYADVGFDAAKRIAERSAAKELQCTMWLKRCFLATYRL